MRTSAEFLADLEPIIERIAGGPLNETKVRDSMRENYVADDYGTDELEAAA